MAIDYKTGTHWQALNRIWKALNPTTRETVKDDFRLLSDFVKSQGSGDPQKDAPPKADHYDHENRFLDGMSSKTKKYALSSLLRGVDVHKNIMDLIVANHIKDMDTLWDTYTLDTTASDDQIAVREIMCFCLERARLQGNA